MGQFLSSQNDMNGILASALYAMVSQYWSHTLHILYIAIGVKKWLKNLVTKEK